MTLTEAAKKHRRSDAGVIYTDLGITPAMSQGVERAKAAGVDVEERELGGGWAKP